MFGHITTHRFYHVFQILYLVWGPYTTILFYQILFSNVTAD
jgi:hypothetical protein